ncbi:hypothetical protein P691DRAFT_467228 [Macrolepiota fuliginosa MF-IS2]|uniref:Secreted protein n=1 Tax=Macrolepiota fuliginosa MF-IS2 TaxID=1400762 RepID=A0A9P5X4C2_9AGAR|nr:hypothetical protein P691DRAFT_467228 [Macrolepiota fuliginosa MF-IS2]
MFRHPSCRVTFIGLCQLLLLATCKKKLKIDQVAIDEDTGKCFFLFINLCRQDVSPTHRQEDYDSHHCLVGEGCRRMHLGGFELQRALE